MFEKFKVAIPDFDSGELFKRLRQSITEVDPDTLKQRDDSSCELIEVRKGKLPAILIINGFLSENEASSKDWLEVVDSLYPNNQVIRVRWKAGNFADMVFNKGIVPEGVVGGGGKFGVAAAVIARANFVSMVTTAGMLVVDKVVGHWKLSFYETIHVARDLARMIEDSPNLSQCILMGHSLGGRIVRHTLNEILTPNAVSVAYLLAGAISSEPEVWEPIMEKHTTLKLINCMSTSDYVLKSAYRAGTLWDHKPAGLAPILDEVCEYTLNLDVSKHVQGHMKFKQKELGAFLKNELSKLEQDKRNQLYLV